MGDLVGRKWERQKYRGYYGKQKEGGRKGREIQTSTWGDRKRVGEREREREREREGGERVRKRKRERERES